MRHVAVLLAWIGCATAVFAEAPQAFDWPQWQGPDRNAISQEKGLLQAWPAGGPKLVWKVTELGGGDSTPSVAAGRIFGMSNRGQDEVVWALNEQDGTPVWTTRLGPAFQQDKRQSNEGPGCTPTVDGDHLYVIGMAGNVACLSVDKGTLVWQRNLQTDFGGGLPAWSFRESPLIDGDKVIVTPGGKEATLVALEKTTGKTVWTSVLPEAAAAEPAPETTRPDQPRRGGRGRGSSAGAAYASAITINTSGQKQYVQLTAKSLMGVAAEDGKLLWRYDRPANQMGINCSTPIFQDGLVFAASAYGNGGGAVKLEPEKDGTFEAKEVYFSTSMQNHHGGMIVHEGCLYGANGGNGGGFLICLDFQTGEILWRARDAQKGALAMADERLYLRTEEGTMLLIEPSRSEYLERGRFEQPNRSNKPAWAHPIIANGKLYLRDHDVLLCYDVKAGKSKE